MVLSEENDRLSGFQHKFRCIRLVFALGQCRDRRLCRDLSGVRRDGTSQGERCGHAGNKRSEAPESIF
jgi:hypothetical protein